jgi:hypothetical protein
MRRVIWVGVLLGLSMTGCRERIRSAATERSESRSTVASGAENLPPSEQASTSATDDKSPATGGSIVDLEAITLTAPSNWTRKPASSSFVAAEFSLPRAEGDDAEGRLTISTAGGSVQANIDRWKSQFDPQPSAAAQEEFDVAGFKVSIVDLSGEFNEQRGPFAPAVKRPNYRMIGAVIPVSNQLHFVKAAGPEKTIQSHADDIRQFIRSAKLKK